jgi:hypothetical protein
MDFIDVYFARLHLPPASLPRKGALLSQYLITEKLGGYRMRMVYDADAANAEGMVHLDIKPTTSSSSIKMSVKY